MENWEYNATFSGIAQGSGISPILANIYLNEFDRFMEDYKKGFDKGTGRKGTMSIPESSHTAKGAKPKSEKNGTATLIQKSRKRYADWQS